MYLNEEQMKDDNAVSTIPPGKSANVVLTEYAPFGYGPDKAKTMPKHLGTDADTNEKYEFVGFAFHACVKDLNDAITPGVTVIHVKCIDNSTKYPDYELSVVGAPAKTDPNASVAPF